MLRQKNLPKVDFERMPDTVAIIGSRSFEDNKTTAARMEKIIRTFVRQLPESAEIISGGARGIDTYAANAAKRYKRKLHVEWPDKEISSPRRYFVRNDKIVDYVRERNGIIVAFGEQARMEGTVYTLRRAEELGVARLVYRFGRMPLRVIGVDQYGCDVLL